MKRVVLWVCTLLMTLMASVCVAGTYSPYFATEPPQEVREHVASRWPDYEFEDYCEVRGTSKGDYGFALLHKQSERILVGYHRVNGEMKYWLKNAGAVPQGKEEAWFDVGTAGWIDETDWIGNFTGRQVYDDGLCFSVKPDVEIPPSLVNIYQELHDDLGCYIPNNGYLKKWADQGVLLLNTVLTVRAHQANSHQGRGWEEFTDSIIRAVNEQDRPIVYLLWGRPAQMKKSMLHNPKHLILTAPHPSPLSAYRGFFGCKHFSQTNEFLRKNGVEPIDWQIENI